MAKKESREYTSTGDTRYHEPLPNHKNPFEGWIRGGEELKFARYVSKKNAAQIKRKYGLEKKAIKFLFNKQNPIDYRDVGGILFYLRKKSKKLQGSRIKRIKPGFDGQEVIEQSKKVDIDKLVSDWIIEDNQPYEDPDNIPLEESK